MSEAKPKASGRGGFRPGSGRPEVGGRVTVSLGTDLLARVDEGAAAAGLTRAAFLRQILTGVLIPPCERCGSVELVRKMRSTICGGCRVVRAYR